MSRVIKFAKAGGPRYVVGSSFFTAASPGQPITWENGTITYYTDQGNLSPILAGPDADAFVADAFSRWTAPPSVALIAIRGGQLAEAKRLPARGVERAQQLELIGIDRREPVHSGHDHREDADQRDHDQWHETKRPGPRRQSAHPTVAPSLCAGQIRDEDVQIGVGPCPERMV